MMCSKGETVMRRLIFRIWVHSNDEWLSTFCELALPLSMHEWAWTRIETFIVEFSYPHRRLFAASMQLLDGALMKLWLRIMVAKERNGCRVFTSMQRIEKTFEKLLFVTVN